MESVKDEKKEVDYEHIEANSVITFDDGKVEKIYYYKLIINRYNGFPKVHINVASKFIYGEEKKICTTI